MADFSKELLNFEEIISFSKKRIEDLKKGRNALRDKIKKYFINNGYKVPNFFMQGSYSLGTLIEPIEGEYDLDDGVYLNHLDDDKDSWPSTESIHNFLFKSVENHTQEVKDKKNCVRVVYKNDKHIDLPMYTKSEEKYYIPKKYENQWVERDPKQFKDWFLSKANEHEGNKSRRVIKYIKAWKDFKDVKITGIIISILVVNNFENADNEVDSLIETLKNIIKDLKENKKLLHPIHNEENLISKWSESKLDDTLKKLNDFKEKLELAKESDDDETYEILIKLFGDRFPTIEKSDSRDSNKVIIIDKPIGSWRI